MKWGWKQDQEEATVAVEPLIGRIILKCLPEDTSVVESKKASKQEYLGERNRDGAELFEIVPPKSFPRFLLTFYPNPENRIFKEDETIVVTCTDIMDALHMVQETKVNTQNQRCTILFGEADGKVKVFLALNLPMLKSVKESELPDGGCLCIDLNIYK
jgi:hypothetical protein